MNLNGTKIIRLAFIAMASTLAAACIAVLPMPGKSGKETSKTTTAPAAILCNIEGKQLQDLSDGTTKATITQSCEETVVFVQNLHEKYPKRCRVLINNQVTELYILPGESRSLTQKGPTERNSVQLGCVNDWNKTR